MLAGVGDYWEGVWTLTFVGLNTLLGFPLPRRALLWSGMMQA